MATPYPAGPTNVPAGLTAAPRGYQRRAYIAVFSLLGFIAVYVGLTATFAYQGYTFLGDAVAGGNHAFAVGVVGLVCSFIAVFLGKALFFIRRGQPDNLTELGDAEPQLVEFIHRIADDVGAPRPYKIFLSPKVNAAVFYDLSLLNLLIPSRKNLMVGIGLVNVLTLTEFKAVLAHEFGHFAQRSMAVGRWVYVGQQVAAHIVGKRDILDGLLMGLSNIDLRIAWIGWIMRTIVWSIRSVMDSLFRVVIVAERALSRQMELQADLVAVSVTGSDALVHALHKLRAADEAWDRAAGIAGDELAAGRAVEDLFTMQTRVLEHHQKILGAEAAGTLPPLPEHERDRAQHRVFATGLAQAPQMWSTHPPSHVREDNAKAQYLPVALDDRPAWVLFVAPAQTRAMVTEQLIEPPEDAMRLDVETAVSKVDDFFDHRHLDPAYRGLYLGRRVTRASPKPQSLYSEVPTDPGQALQALYPESISATVKACRELGREHGELEALQRGALTAPGGVIVFRGQQLRRKELPGVVAEVHRELEQQRARLVAHDATTRTAYWAAAKQLGGGWAEYLESLLALLHYAEHTEADVDDAHATLMNALEIAFADGRVSDSERRDLRRVAQEVQFALYRTFEGRQYVVLSPRVAQRLGCASWPDALPTEYGLLAPTEENLGDFLDIERDWFTGFSNPLGGLRHAALESLLEVEAHIARCTWTREDPGEAPGVCQAPLNYIAMCTGGERDKQTTLRLWDRFATADGFGPGIARLAVTGSIVAAVLFAGGVVGMPTAYIYNGLHREVQVRIGETTTVMDAHSRAEVEFELPENLRVETRTMEGELIEQFDPPMHNRLSDYAYNVAGAAPLVSWVAVYGGGRGQPERSRGRVRWLQTDADYVFEVPPDSLSTRGTSTTHTVLSVPSPLTPATVTYYIKDAAQLNALGLVHAQWDPPDIAAMWIEHWIDEPGFKAVLDERAAQDESNVRLGRMRQDYLDHDEACAHHQELAKREPGNSDRMYLAARCIEDEPARDTEMLRGHKADPGHPWFCYGAAWAMWNAGDSAAALRGMTLARRQLGSGSFVEQIVEHEARMLRLVEGPDADLDELANLSPRVAYLRALSRGDELENRGYVELQAGRAHESGPPPNDRLIRLIGASDNAPDSVVKRALDLAPDRGIDAATVWSALALAKREGRELTGLLAFIEAVPDEQRAVMMTFWDREALLSEDTDVHALLVPLVPELRGHAYAMGSITLGSDAPPQWRTNAARLLFVPERPYFDLPK